MSVLADRIGSVGVVNVLGWTLLHFVWQGALVALLLWCALALMSGASARMRYTVCCLALVVMVLLPVITFGRLGGFERDGAGVTVVAPWVVNVDAVGGAAAHESLSQRMVELLQVSAWVLPWIWLLGVVVCAGRLGMGLAGAKRLRRTGVSAVEKHIADTFAWMANRVGVQRAVTLLESVRVEAPTVVGWLKPVVLLPACCFAGLSTEQMEALLAHELAHIRRHDYLLAVLQAVIEALLFYHPAVWWVSRQVRRERECCCDDIAAECCGDRLEYARALSWLEEQRLVGPAIGLGATGGVLRMRIRRVLGYREGSVASQMGAVAVLCVLAGSFTMVLVREARAERSANAATANSSFPTVERIAAEAGGATDLKQAKALRRAHAAAADAAPKLSPVYAKWLNEDVVWILMPNERDEFLATRSDAERDRFIKLFWLQRDEEPGAFSYKFRAQHYERIAYANEHFGANGVPGWKTDRGRTYIVNGKPESVESRPNGDSSRVGSQVSAPFEVWHYGHPAVADQDTLVFIDSCRCGVFQYSAQGMAGETSKPANVQSTPSTPSFQRAALSLGSTSRSAAAQQAGVGELDGVIVDPTGAVMPRVSVSVANVQTGERKTKQTDDEGRYSFSIPSGRYTVGAAATGFRMAVAQNVQVAPADPVHLTLKLQVGAASEYMKVSGRAASSAAPAAGQSSNAPIRVSPGVIAGNAVSQTQPVYPAEAKATHIQGTVVLSAMITKTGDVEQLRVVSGPDELQAAAMDAVKQWKYKPYLLNGNPTEVETSIRVNFSFGDPGPGAPQPAAGALLQPHGPVRVSAGVMAGQAIVQPSPQYPPDAKTAGVQGTVVLHTLVSKEGDIEDLQVVSGPQPLTQSAIDAVKQWKYKPYLLNGEPVEIETTINVNYSLAE